MLSKMYSFVCKKDSVFKKLIEQVCNEKFFSKSSLVRNYSKAIDRIKKNKKYCIIKKVIWDHKYINVCFINEVLSLILWSLENGYFPLVDIRITDPYNNNEYNLWESMFLQPLGKDLDYVIESENYIICPVTSYIKVSMQDARENKKIEFWNCLINDFIVFNDFCQNYISKEKIDIIQGKKVLGCLIRGTDYTKLRPQGHPIQPDISEFINTVSSIKKEDKLDYIYLATEDEKLAKEVKEVFGNIVLENKRVYYDTIYEQNDFNDISQVWFDRDNDSFLKSIEYLSSMCILADCDSLVAGLCGGSQFAVFKNGNHYITCHLFDKGVF